MVHDTMLKYGAKAVYNFARRDLKSYTIVLGHSTYSVDNIWLDRIPINLMAILIDKTRR